MLRRLIGAGCLAGVLVLGAGGSRAAEGARPSGAGERQLVTTLRGTLSAPETNAASGVVAVLHFRIQGRKPCLLRAMDADVAAKLRDLTAEGAQVMVAGQPGAVAFMVLSIREDERRSPATNGLEAARSFLPSVQWGGVRGGGDR